MATVPAEHTKTNTEYLWLLPNEIAYAVDLVRGHQGTGFNTKDKLRESLENFYTRQILEKAAVPTKDAKGNLYSMKSIRKYRATEWVKLVTEYKVMKWHPLPPNPLQHKSASMTLAVYAEEGADNELKARRRCVDKYGGGPVLRQDWMDIWDKVKTNDEAPARQLRERRWHDNVDYLGHLMNK